MKRLKRGIFLLALLAGVSSCQTMRVLDERLAGRLQCSHWLKPPQAATVMAVHPAKAGRTVKLRGGPGNRYPAIRVLAVGEEVAPLGSAGPWRAVRIGRESGFVRSRDLRPVVVDRRLFVQP